MCDALCEITIDADVYYNYFPPSRGRTECGVPMEPDEYACVEIMAVVVSGVDVLKNMSEEQVKKLENDIKDNAG